MKVTTILDPSREEEVIIYAHSRSGLVEEIERLASREPVELLGFQGDSALLLDFVKVDRFTVENGKVFAAVGKERYQIRQRLYQLEQQVPAQFIKINQSCLANLRRVARFEAAFSGSLRVVFKNGDIDYVSRRNVRAVKERLGL